MRTKSIELVAAAFLLASCASQERVSLLAGEGQQSVIRDGDSALISAKQNVVMIRPVSGSVYAGDRPAFAILIGNMTPQRIDFVPPMIRASLSGAGYAGHPIKVFSYEELVKEEHRRQVAGAVFAGLAGVARGMNAANAGYSNTYGSVSLSDNYGNRAYGTYSATTYDSYRAYSAQQLATAQTSVDFQNLRATGEANLARLQGSIIKSNTILPGEMYGGQVVLEPVKHKRNETITYVIAVNLPGETHTFTIQHSAN
jgi:hypothetical protein